MGDGKPVPAAVDDARLFEGLVLVDAVEVDVETWEVLDNFDRAASSSEANSLMRSVFLNRVASFVDLCVLLLVHCCLEGGTQSS